MLKTIYSNLQNHDCDLCGGPLDNVIKHVIVITENSQRLELHKECSDIAIETTDNKEHKLCSLKQLLENMSYKLGSDEVVQKVINAYNKTL